MRRTARKLAGILSAALACTAFAAHAGDIYKCMASGVTSYQSMPCERGQAQVQMSVVGSDNVARKANVVAAPQSALRPGPWRHQELALGISDDEVLNMPAWGRPNRIVRTRLPRGWQEVWIYGNPVVGDRALVFTNARLTDIGDAAPSQVAVTAQ